MVMIIIHIAYITMLVTNDAWNAYDVLEVYKIHHEHGWVHISRSGNTVVGWYGYGRGRGPLQGACLPGHEAKTVVRKKISY